jgi:predicted dehydrogenase
MIAQTVQNVTTAGKPMQSMIRWGILGAGGIAGKFVEGLRSLPDATVQAVASRSQSRAEEFARRHGIPRAHAGYEALANDPDVDIVYVATTNNVHKEHSLLCIESGKPVICEKPFAVTAAETRDVIAAARRRRVFCMEAMWTRFLPLMAQLRNIIGAGAIGDVRMVTAELGFAAPSDPENRFFDPQLGGGAMLDLGIYPLSFIYYILGEPQGVSAQASVGDTHVDEQAAAILEYPKGKLGVLSTSLLGYLPNEAAIIGTKGCIRVHAPLHRPTTLTLTDYGKQYRSAAPGSRVRRIVGGIPLVRGVFDRALVLVKGTAEIGEEVHTFPLAGNGFNYEAAEAMRCLRTGLLETSIMPLDETLSIMETMDAIRNQWSAGKAAQ